jgi:hypothetical protein
MRRTEKSVKLRGVEREVYLSYSSQELVPVFHRMEFITSANALKSYHCWMNVFAYYDSWKRKQLSMLWSEAYGYTSTSKLLSAAKLKTDL